jgi:hypothetical protein
MDGSHSPTTGADEIACRHEKQNENHHNNTTHHMIGIEQISDYWNRTDIDDVDTSQADLDDLEYTNTTTPIT